MSTADSKTADAQSPPNFDCNVFAGSDIGYLKGVSFGAKAFRNLNKIEKLNKKLGISCLCWGADDESVIYAGCKGGDVIHHDVTSGMNQFVPLEYEKNDAVALKEICVHDSKLVTAFSNGDINIDTIEYEGSLVTTSQVDHFSSLTESDKTLQCMDHNKSKLHMLATGGQENPLRVWDINNLSADPIFVAKNLRNDWLNLRVPVWVTKTKFYPLSDKIVTANGQGTVRLYDPSTPQRRPVIEVKTEEYPITAMAVRPNSDFQVFVGNTVGSLFTVDLRKKSVVRAFKGNKGCVTDIKCHPEFPVFSVCSTDRYVRCYDPDQKPGMIHSLYVQVSLNCILFSSKWEKQDNAEVKDGGKVSSKKKKKVEDISSESDEDPSEDEAGEDLWNKMEVVQTKKRRIE